MKKQSKNKLRLVRKHRSNIVKGTFERPRVVFCKSNLHISTQVINDESKKTLISVSTKHLLDDKLKQSKSLKNCEWAGKLGEELAKKLKDKEINKIVFDRNGYIYQGKIESFCNALRKEKIIF